jgi:hypothetical protein
MQFFNFKCEQPGPAIQNSASVAVASAAQNNKTQELAAIADLNRPSSIKEQAETFWIPRSVVKVAREHGSYKF